MSGYSEYTRLSTVVWLWLGAAVCAAVVLFSQPKPGDPALSWFAQGFRLLFMLAGIVLAVAGIMAAWDWLRYIHAERIEQLNRAKVAAQCALAYAYKGLPGSTVEVIESHAHAEIITIPGIPEPVHALQCVHMKVPMDFVCAFIDASRETAPYLYPEREARDLRDSAGDSWRNAVALATALTNQMINMKLAEKAAGPYAAMLTVELRDAARAVGVTMGEE